MAQFAIFSEAVWDKNNWLDDMLPEDSLKYAGFGDLSDLEIPITYYSIPLVFTEIEAALETAVLDVVLHDDRDFWSNLTFQFQSIQSLDEAELYSVPLVQAEMIENGTFLSTQYLNALETKGTSAGEKIVGTKLIDLVNAGNGNDVVIGNGGSDVIKGGKGNDRLKGDAGDDELMGGSGRDRLFGGSGNDTLSGQKGKDILKSGDGFDFLFGNGGSDTLIAEGGTNKMYGGSGRDVLMGFGNNEMFGGNGDDTLIGSGSLTGGSGTDRFVVTDNGTYNILDFEHGLEKIDMRQSGFGVEDIENSFFLGGRTSVFFSDGLNSLDIHVTGFVEVTQDDFIF